MHLGIGSLFCLICLGCLVSAECQVYSDCFMPPFICQAIPKNELTRAFPEWKIVGSYHDVIYAYGRALETLKMLKSGGGLPNISDHLQLTHPNVTTWKRWVKFHQHLKSPDSQEEVSQIAKHQRSSDMGSVWVIIVPRDDYKHFFTSENYESFPKLIILVMLKMNSRMNNEFSDLDVRLTEKRHEERPFRGFSESSSKGFKQLHEDGQGTSSYFDLYVPMQNDRVQIDGDETQNSFETISKLANYKRHISRERSVKDSISKEPLDSQEVDVQLVRPFLDDNNIGDSLNEKRKSAWTLILNRSALLNSFLDEISLSNILKMERNRDIDDDHLSEFDEQLSEEDQNSDEDVLSAFDELIPEVDRVHSYEIDVSKLREPQAQIDQTSDQLEQSFFAGLKVGVDDDYSSKLDNQEAEKDQNPAFGGPFPALGLWDLFLDKPDLNFPPIDNTISSSDKEMSEELSPRIHLLGETSSTSNTVDKFLESLQVSKERQVEIEKATKNQSYCAEWHNQRRYRLTASTFGIVYNWKDSYKRLVYRLLYCFTQKNEGKKKALAWGKDNERVAANEYAMLHNVTVEPSGLIIDLKKGFLAASPDGFIGDDILCEIKCPYFLRDEDPIEIARKGNLYCCDYDQVRDKITLKRDHYYYYQIQGQLGISGRKTGVFILWCPSGLISENIEFDPELWERMILKLEDFYRQWLVPELLYNYHRFAINERDDRT